MKNYSTPNVITSKKQTAETVGKERPNSSPAASTLAFLRQFARSYYAGVPIGISVISLN